MRLASLLHLSQLSGVELTAFDPAPVISCGIHWKTGTYGAVSADNHVVLACPAIPVAKTQSAVCVSRNSRYSTHRFVPRSGPVAVPANAAEVRTVRHPHECFHFL